MRFLKSGLKKAVGGAVRRLPALRRSMTQGLNVFLFHDVTDEPSPFNAQYALAVSRATFRRQAAWIRDNFEVIHPARLFDQSVLPPRAALITFDDGFLGTFENGLEILRDMQLPSVVFVNMRAVLEQTPILSVVACYLNQHVPEFAGFADSVGLRRPYHLTLTPKLLAEFEQRSGALDRAAVLDYQGQFADLQTMRKWSDARWVLYGSHLFDHWNVRALDSVEFQHHYQSNERALAQFDNRANLFAFPNGQPVSCFSDSDVEQLRQLGAGRVFSARGGVNRDSTQYLLSRCGLGEQDADEDGIWFRMGRAAAEDAFNRRR
ncbi:polysaccharide deacetylase family protein [Steroidobacter flavus]|uniref:Polysaccharide deacetylase family protein n=1 Tax=Steroidobacter flavus TaxID=1842136 RepID=A0ABV8T3V0_9GAMM